MSTITSENLVEVTGAKAGQRAILKDGKAILVGMGGKTAGGGSGGGSTEFYKCAEVIPATEGSGYLTVVCSESDASGDYKLTDESLTGSARAFAYQSNDSTIYQIKYENGYWILLESISYTYLLRASGSGTESVSGISGLTWETHPSFPGTCTMESITAVVTEGTPASWSGYLYDTETKEFSDTLTEGLEYNSQFTPKEGYCYDKSATIVVYGLYNYSLFDRLEDKFRSTMTGQAFVDYNSPTFLEYEGMKCVRFYSESSYMNATIEYDCERLPADESPRFYIMNIYTSGNSGSLANFFTHGNDDGLRFRAYTYNNSGTCIAFWVNDGYDNVTECHISPENATTNAWVNLIFAYTGSDIRIYSNGVLMASAEITLAAKLSENQRLVIGGHFDTNFYNDYMNNFKIVYGTMTDEEIAAEAQRCLAMVTE